MNAENLEEVRRQNLARNNSFLADLFGTSILESNEKDVTSQNASGNDFCVIPNFGNFGFKYSFSEALKNMKQQVYERDNLLMRFNMFLDKSYLHSSAVLLHGASGVGKSLIADVIMKEIAHSLLPCVTVRCDKYANLKQFLIGAWSDILNSVITCVVAAYQNGLRIDNDSSQTQPTAVLGKTYVAPSLVGCIDANTNTGVVEMGQTTNRSQKSNPIDSNGVLLKRKRSSVSLNGVAINMTPELGLLWTGYKAAKPPNTLVQFVFMLKELLTSLEQLMLRSSSGAPSRQAVIGLCFDNIECTEAFQSDCARVLLQLPQNCHPCIKVMGISAYAQGLCNVQRVSSICVTPYTNSELANIIVGYSAHWYIAEDSKYYSLEEFTNLIRYICSFAVPRITIYTRHVGEVVSVMRLLWIELRASHIVPLFIRDGSKPEIDVLGRVRRVLTATQSIDSKVQELLQFPIVSKIENSSDRGEINSYLDTKASIQKDLLISEWVYSLTVIERFVLLSAYICSQNNSRRDFMDLFSTKTQRKKSKKHNSDAPFRDSSTSNESVVDDAIKSQTEAQLLSRGFPLEMLFQVVFGLIQQHANTEIVSRIIGKAGGTLNADLLFNSDLHRLVSSWSRYQGFLVPVSGTDTNHIPLSSFSAHSSVARCLASEYIVGKVSRFTPRLVRCNLKRDHAQLVASSIGVPLDHYLM